MLSDNPQNSKQEEISQQINLVNNIKTLTIGFALGLTFLLGVWRGAATSPILFLVFLLFLITILFNYLHRKIKDLKKTENLYFINAVFEIILITAIIHYTGGIEWIGIVFFVPIIVQANIVLSIKKGMAASLLSLFSFAGLVFLEYAGVLPHYKFLSSEPANYRNFSYISLTIIAGVGFALFYTAFIASVFSRQLKTAVHNIGQEKERAASARQELEEAKTALEVKVRARTEELEKQAGDLESQVQARTQDLQQKIDELEKFNRLTIGRELKMIELKKEIRRLKAQLEKIKKQSA